MPYKQTASGDLMHVRECSENDVTYGMITIKLKNQLLHSNEAEKALMCFINRLQHTFAIRHTTGLQTETFLRQNKTAVTHYWQDAERQDWKVKGWTDGKAVMVLYIKNICAVNVEK